MLIISGLHLFIALSYGFQKKTVPQLFPARLCDITTGKFNLTTVA